MNKGILQLYPLPGGERDLQGLYLRHKLHQQGTVSRPLVYTNFISSLDGRIGIPKTGTSTHQVPTAIANDRDWRLFQELAGQADVLITTARYFRQLGNREAQDNLPVGQEACYDYIHQWRETQGLAPQPAVAILSSRLDFPVSTLALYQQRSVFVITGKAAAPEKVQDLEQQGIKVLQVGSDQYVGGNDLISCLSDQGYQSIYAIGGPRMMSTLVSAGVLNRLYLSVAHRLLGGTEFDTFVWGESFDPASNLSMRELYYDTHAPEPCGQWLSVFDVNNNQGSCCS